MKLIYSAASWAVLALSVSVAAHGAQVWTEGVNYFLVQPPRPTSVAPGGPAGQPVMASATGKFPTVIGA